MARIRSVHPGQATDEDFVRCSRDARLFAIHLRCEADDYGIFEWKPLTLKMRIFPADEDLALDAIERLLAELVENNQIARFELRGRAYGAIRNFCFWQSPKSPRGLPDLPEEVREYVALNAEQDGNKPGPKPKSHRPVPKQFGTSSEMSPLGVGEGVGEGKGDSPPTAPNGAASPPSGGESASPEGEGEGKRPETGRGRRGRTRRSSETPWPWSDGPDAVIPDDFRALAEREIDGIDAQREFLRWQAWCLGHDVRWVRWKQAWANWIRNDRPKTMRSDWRPKTVPPERLRPQVGDQCQRLIDYEREPEPPPDWLRSKARG